MNTHNGANPRSICIVVALVFFAMAAVTGPWGVPAAVAPWYHNKLVAGGLFFWALSEFFTP